MLPTFIAITVIVALIVLWIISTQRRLVVLDENISNAMSQTAYSFPAVLMP